MGKGWSPTRTSSRLNLVSGPPPCLLGLHDRKEETNRIKWARLLYQEQKRNRERLLDEPGVFLCDWDDETSNFVPIATDDESAADTATLCYRTPDSKTTLALIGRKLEIDLNMLLASVDILKPLRCHYGHFFA